MAPAELRASSERTNVECPQQFYKTTWCVENVTMRKVPKPVEPLVSKKDWKRYVVENRVEIARYIASGDLPIVQDGETLRIKESALERLIADGKLPPVEDVSKG